MEAKHFHPHAYSAPTASEGAARLGPDRSTALELIGRLCDPDIPIAEIHRLLESKPVLSERILSSGGAGAASGLCRPITSVRHAALLLGKRRLQCSILLVILKEIYAASPHELIFALTRARMCELLTMESAPDECDVAFAAGLISGLEPVLKAPALTLTRELAIRDNITAALVDRTGIVGSILADVSAWQLRGRKSPPEAGSRRTSAEIFYVDAAQWATDLYSLTEPANCSPPTAHLCD